jgi:hypothetical protein
MLSRCFRKQAFRRATQETNSVPRLTTIIPHQTTDEALEATILSVLENRPSDCEIIVVHHGNYADPYQLGDELLLVQEQTTNPVALLNAGLMVARAPVVCVLAPGVKVSGMNWADQACQRLSPGTSIASLAVPIHHSDPNRPVLGISQAAVSDSTILQSGRIDQRRPGPTAGPQLSGGFYRRRALLAVGGWNEAVCWDNADIELALWMHQLSLPCELFESTQLESTLPMARSLSRSCVKQRAELAVGYGLCSSGATAAMSDLLRGCLGGNISASVAWATGVLAARASQSIQKRLAAAQQRIDQWPQSHVPAERHSAATIRRAA